MQSSRWLSGACVALVIAVPGLAAGPKPGPSPESAAPSSQYFPPQESQGGWRSLLPAQGDPDTALKSRMRSSAGVDWDKLNDAWKYNATAEGASGLLVIRHGQIVGEWYKDCDRETTFNLYSCSKSYTSLAFGLLLAGSEAGKLPGSARLTLDTKVLTREWLPEVLPLSDPRKADITLRHLLTMTSGIGGEEPPAFAPFEWALGKIEGSAWSGLKGKPGTVFHYSNAGIAHLVLIFNHAAGKDLYPFLKERVFGPLGMEKIRWHKLGGDGEIGPFDQGYTGINTTAREHARFLYLALHRGRWAGRQLVPEGYYEFAFKGTEVKPEYGGLWWVFPHHRDAPRDLVQTAGFRQNHGFVVPSLDLVIVRVGDGFRYPKDFEHELVKRVLAAVSSSPNEPPAESSPGEESKSYQARWPQFRGSGGVAWKQAKQVPEVPSPLYYQGRVYLVTEKGIVVCREARSGREIYRQRLGGRGNCYSSPVVGDGKIYIGTDGGSLVVIKPGDRFQVLAKNDLGEGIMATPALVDDKIYVRTDRHLYAFGESGNARR